MDDPTELLSSLRADALVLIFDLERDLAAIAESTAESPDDEHDAEGSTVGYERARVGALLRQARERLVELSAALERLAVGDFGRCDDCCGWVAAARLEALPATRLCLECASRRTRSPGLS
jgi:DnaK suppressor protein